MHQSIFTGVSIKLLGHTGALGRPLISICIYYVLNQEKRPARQNAPGHTGAALRPWSPFIDVLSFLCPYAIAGESYVSTVITYR
jgi:hypothetical protein